MVTPSDPHTAPRDAAVPAHQRVSWFARQGPAWGGVLMTLAAVAAAGGMAWALAEMLAPLGPMAPALAAAIGTALLLIPLMVLLLKLARQNERAQDLLARLDTLDTLTGVANRAHFTVLIEREWARARRYGSGAGIVLIDLDRYRRICEQRGPSAGDAVLRELAAVASSTLRGADAIARFGQSQLAVFLAHADALGALDVAERIRERVEALEVPWQDQRLRVSVSLGVATLRPAHAHLQSLLQDAEAAVEAARQAGGNCVRAAPVDPLREASSNRSLGDNHRAGPA